METAEWTFVPVAGVIHTTDGKLIVAWKVQKEGKIVFPVTVDQETVRISQPS